MISEFGISETMSGNREVIYSCEDLTAVDSTTDDAKKFRRKSFVMRDLNRKLKKIKRQVGSFDGSSNHRGPTPTVEEYPKDGIFYYHDLLHKFSLEVFESRLHSYLLPCRRLS